MTVSFNILNIQKTSLITNSFISIAMGKVLTCIQMKLIEIQCDSKFKKQVGVPDVFKQVPERLGNRTTPVQNNFNVW